MAAIPARRSLPPGPPPPDVIRPPELRRSWLFVGGVDRHALESAGDAGADVIIQEFEDFTPPGLRPRARELSAGLMTRWKQQGRVATARINPLENDGADDLAAVMPTAPHAILLPKVAGPDHVVALDAAIGALERIHGIEVGSTEIVPNVESAAGLRRTYEICRASPRVSACLVASEDMAADLGAERSVAGAELDHVRARFLVDCTAAGIPAIDCPYTWTDAAGLRRETLSGRRLGYRAKSLVTGEHAAVINELLTPSAAEAAGAERIIGAFESARAAGLGRVELDGSLVEMPTVANARRLLDRARALAAWEDSGE